LELSYNINISEDMAKGSHVHVLGRRRLRSKTWLLDGNMRISCKGEHRQENHLTTDLS